MGTAFEALALKMALIVAPVSQEATLLFAGDAMQHSAQIEAARTGGGWDYTGYFDSIKEYVSAADYAVVNLETPLGGAPYSGYPCFCAPDEFAAALKDAGFDMFLTANNHTLDRRDRGVCRTLQVLDSLRVDHIGTYRDNDGRCCALPCIKDIKGFKVGFVNYTYGTNGFIPGKGAVVDYIDTTLIKRDIAAARAAGAEIMTVALHWGDEYVLKPNATQRALALWIKEQGVELIIGSHPHVIQPMELCVTDSSDTTRRCLTVYSLGNFVSNMKTTDTRGGVMTHVTLRRTPSGRAYVHRAAYAPVFVRPASHGYNYRVVNALDTIDDAVDEPRRRAFLSNAIKVFDRHNVSVPVHHIF